MRKWIRKALTKWTSVRAPRGKREWQIEVPPSEKLVYGVYFAIASLICLTVLEIIYILALRSFSSEIFAAITLVTGTILGTFFGAKT